jgi:SH3-like domain-containing protein
VAAAFLVGCASRPAVPAAKAPIGAAYAGPATVNLRKDLTSRSAVIGTVSHGEHLDVMETRRRFVRVRNAQGLEGWTDSNLLLAPQQMDDLARLAETVAKLPSQGSATTFDVLNMHTEPSRQSPGFFQIPEGAAVEVIAHRVAPRVVAVPPKPPSVRRVVAKKSKAKQAAPLLPPPSPAPPPSDWLALSRPRAADLLDYTPPSAAPPVPVALDDWSLVRTRDNKVGWVLSRALSMAIPDEVAQYAEGHRITAYLPLGEVKDGDQTKHNWVWTTMVSGGAQPYEFESFRVFVWSKSRHRYETAYIERNVKGYYPLEADSKSGEDEDLFSLVLEDKDGQRYKRSYGFSGYRVRMISKVPYQRPAELPAVRPANGFDLTDSQVISESAWRRKFGELRQRWFKR